MARSRERYGRTVGEDLDDADISEPYEGPDRRRSGQYQQPVVVHAQLQQPKPSKPRAVMAGVGSVSLGTFAFWLMTYLGPRLVDHLRDSLAIETAHNAAIEAVDQKKLELEKDIATSLRLMLEQNAKKR